MYKILLESIRQIRAIILAKPYLYSLRKGSTGPKEIGLVIFSYDRPMQLEALLESVARFWPDANKISVIYKTSSERFSDAYRRIFAVHPNVTGLLEYNFKSQLIDAVGSLEVRWTCLMVDDDVLIRPVGREIIPWLENGHVVSLRLGSHITKCQPLGYVQQNPTRLANMISNGVTFIRWKWHGSTGDWELPFSLDGNIVNRLELLHHLRSRDFGSPNTLEGTLTNLTWTYMWESGVAFDTARLVNIPMNRVQNSALFFPSMDISTKELLTMWEEGLRPNFTDFAARTWPSCHIEVMPTFEKIGRFV